MIALVPAPWSLPLTALWTAMWTLAVASSTRRDQQRVRLRQLRTLLDEDLETDESQVVSALRRQVLLARRAPENIAEIVHELRTPLTIVLSSIELITEGYARTDEERSELLQQIRSACHHSLFLVNDLLDDSAIQTNALRLEVQDCNAQEVLEDARRVLLPLCESCGNEILVESEDKALGFRGDRRRTLQILFNLVSNSAKYSDSDTTIWVRAFEDTEANALVFEVEDEGFGIPDDRRAALFQRYERLHTDESPEVDGTGLGLSLCSRLTERMGGSIGYRPRTGAEGSIFWVRLPLVAEQATVDG